MFPRICLMGHVGKHMELSGLNLSREAAPTDSISVTLKICTICLPQIDHAKATYNLFEQPGLKKTAVLPTCGSQI